MYRDELRWQFELSSEALLAYARSVGQHLENSNGQLPA
jgi:hypothetical protein